MALRVAEVVELRRDLVIANASARGRDKQLEALRRQIEGECLMIAKRGARRAKLEDKLIQSREALRQQKADLARARREIAALKCKCSRERGHASEIAALKRERGKQQAQANRIARERDHSAAELLTASERLDALCSELEALRAFLPDPALAEPDTGFETHSETHSETETACQEQPSVARVAPDPEDAWFASLESEIQSEEPTELPDTGPLPAPSAMFSYWRDTRIRSQLVDLEIEDAQHFFSLPIARRCQAKPGDLVRILSWSRDDGRFELDLAQRLVNHGNENFRFECVDLRSEVRKQRLLDCSDQALNDFVVNVDRAPALAEPDRYDVVLSDSTLWSHAVAYAETHGTADRTPTTSRDGMFTLFDALSHAMKPDAVLALTERLAEASASLSPAGQEVAERIWQLMPLRYRKGHAEDGDPRGDGNVLAGAESPQQTAWSLGPGEEDGGNPFAVALRERFACEAWACFGHLVDAFIGPHARAQFDPELEADRRFIDQVTQLDEARVASGLLPPRYLAAWLLPRNA